jgi:cytochrome b561
LFKNLCDTNGYCARRVDTHARRLSHGLLYAALVILPGTGIAMGYFSGKGLPFFGATIPGAAVPNGAIAKQAFKVGRVGPAPVRPSGILLWVWLTHDLIWLIWFPTRVPQVHSLTGQAFEYLLALHVGAVGFYHARGVNVLRRMSPFKGT